MTSSLGVSPAVKPLTVWLLQTGEPLHIDPGTPRPMRAMNLADALVAAGHRVVLWSSAFYHQEKRHRSRTADRIPYADRLEIRLIPSPGYQRNIGPGRLWDHAVMGRTLATLLANESSPPDVAFIGYPPIETAAVMARWLRVRGVPSVLDVKDLWPSLFLDPLPGALRPLGRLALAPYYALARRAMRDVTGVTAMAESYVQWAVDFAGRPRRATDRVVPLTPAAGVCTSDQLAEARRWWDARSVTAAPGIFRVMFVGGHISAFDFEPVRAAAVELQQANVPAQFVICGDGPENANLRSLLAGLPNVLFPGWVDLPQIQALAERSQAALAPYRNIENFTKNIPNKVVDSLKLGLPLLSALEGEVDGLVRTHGVGMTYRAAEGSTLAAHIRHLVANPGERDAMAARGRTLFDEAFSFEKVYGGLVGHLEGLAAAASAGATGAGVGR